MSSETASARGDLLATDPGPEPEGRRQRKKAATWLSLHDAAMELSIEKGFEHVTVEEICDRADVSVRTFFNYFPCKEDAVLGGSAGLDQIREAMRARPAGEEPLEAFCSTYLAKLEQIDHRGELMKGRYRLIETNPSLRAREYARLAEFETSLAVVVAERTGLDVDRDPYPRLVAAVGMSVLRTAFFRWQLGDTTDSLVALVAQGFAAVANGLPAPTRAPLRTDSLP